MVYHTSLKHNLARLLVLLTLSLSMAGCCYSQPLNDKQARDLPTISSAWLAYWDTKSGNKELHQVKSKLKQLVYFAASFDAKDKLVIPPEILSSYKINKKVEERTDFLSFVNDCTDEKGKVKLKDTQVLQRVLADKNTRRKHIEAIVSLAQSNGFAGVEIDYENIWKDAKVAELFMQFLPELQAETAKANLGLRVVLEPSTPMQSKTFVQGPEYVVMAYNLFGLHSDVGPKANEKFLLKLLQKMETLPEPKSMALATGGCVWSNKDNPIFITEQQAVAMAEKSGAAVAVDTASRCKHFRYRVDLNVREVWYADAETLEYWTLVCKRSKVNRISIWRLGGNVAIKEVI